eukprot:Tbor_TRINITY_DN4641_c0_g1::TRINITY_DN4641_c0_g1_i1::g.14997::m.14997
MKFIPNAAFDALNTSLNQVDTSGFLITIKLEAFACRPSKSDKSLRTALDAKSQGGSFMTPPLGPHNGHIIDEDDDFRLEKSCSSTGRDTTENIPGTSPIGSTMGNSLGQSEYSSTLNCNVWTPGTGHGTDSLSHCAHGYFSSSASDMVLQHQQQYAQSPQQHHNLSPLLMYSQLNEEQSVKSRMVFLCGALNAIHGSTDYDFSCLAPSDFLLVNPAEFIQLINDKLGSLPKETHEAVGNNGELFWRAITSFVGSESALYNSATQTTECEIFKFVCHNCDPVAQAKLWSDHYLIYNKKHRVIVSVLLYGEGNLYGEVCGRNRTHGADRAEEEGINGMMDDSDDGGDSANLRRLSRRRDRNSDDINGTDQGYREEYNGY